MKAHRRYHFASRCCPAAAPCATCPPPARALVAPQASAEEQVLERAAPSGADACRRRPGATRPTLSRRVAVQGLPDNASRSRDGGTAPRAPLEQRNALLSFKQRGGLHEDILRLVKSRFFVKARPRITTPNQPFPRKFILPSERSRFQKVSKVFSKVDPYKNQVSAAGPPIPTSGAKIIVTDHIITGSNSMSISQSIIIIRKPSRLLLFRPDLTYIC